jgi:lipopolysaccharide export system protein LptA
MLKNPCLYFVACVFWALLLAIPSLAQQKQAQAQNKETPQGQQIELMPGASELVGDILNGEKIRKVKKDVITQVFFKQGQTLMYCDSAYQFIQRNQVEAYSNVMFIDADSTVTTGDTLYYDGNTRKARLRGNVIMRDKQKTVTTRFLDYDLNTKIAYYYNGGTVQDDSSTLTSEFGYYNVGTKISTFRKNVKYYSRDTQLESDTLIYDSNTKIVDFKARTNIRTRQGVVVADRGSYNTVLGTSVFKGRSKIDTQEYTISGDFLDYDKVKEKGIAKGNVEFFGKKDNVIILGDFGKYDGINDRSDVYGNAVMIKPAENSKDTLFVSADTLIAINETPDTTELKATEIQQTKVKNKKKNDGKDDIKNDKTTEKVKESTGEKAKEGKEKNVKITPKKQLYAFRNVKVYRKDFQAKCDSLFYNIADSTIRFFYEPIIWAKNSQMTADSIRAQLRNNIIDKMFLKDKAFVISLDTLRQFNQTKGREIQANFKNSQINKVIVKGNAESLYHILENDTLFTGLNYMKCSDMDVFFNDSSKLEEIMFRGQPDAKLIPPHEIKTEDKALKDFAWRIQEKTEQGEVLGIHAANKYKTGDLVGAKLIIDDAFKVFLKNNTLIFYKQNAEDKDIAGKFFVQLYPKDKNDINIEFRKKGYETVDFKFPLEALLNGTAKHSLALPDYRFSKIIIGQMNEKNKVLWQKLYIVK